MSITIREGRPDDAAECGRICFEAFRVIAEAHDFPPDMPNAEFATRVVASLLAHPEIHGVVAEKDGEIVGSNFLDERNPVAGVGPITVDPVGQNRGVGAVLMRAVINRSAAKAFAGVRLVQAGYHTRSLSLYAKLGFDVREHLSCFQGPALNEPIAGHAVRPATTKDLAACDSLCATVHGFARGGELRDAVARGGASVVERAGRITGYTTGIAFFGHSVAETTEDLQALVAAASSFGGPGFLVPSRDGALMRWCLGRGLRVTQTLTLMTMGLYGEPKGAWLPSVTY